MTERKTILFVCKGNIHRSAVAECCLNKILSRKGLGEQFLAISRGVLGTAGTAPPNGKNVKDYPDEWEFSRPILEQEGLDTFSHHQSTPIDSTIVREAALIFAMDREILIGKPYGLINQFPEYSYKMRLFRELEGKIEDVADPDGLRDAQFFHQFIELIVSVLEERFDHLVNYANLLA